MTAMALGASSFMGLKFGRAKAAKPAPTPSSRPDSRAHVPLFPPSSRIAPMIAPPSWTPPLSACAGGNATVGRSRVHDRHVRLGPGQLQSKLLRNSTRSRPTTPTFGRVRCTRCGDVDLTLTLGGWGRQQLAGEFKSEKECGPEYYAAAQEMMGLATLMSDPTPRGPRRDVSVPSHSRPRRELNHTHS